MLNDKIYYYEYNGESKGPVSPKELEELNISRDTLVWSKGMAEWTQISQVKELSDLYIKLPPPVSSILNNNNVYNTIGTNPSASTIAYGKTLKLDERTDNFKGGLDLMVKTIPKKENRSSEIILLLIMIIILLLSFVLSKLFENQNTPSKPEIHSEDRFAKKKIT